MIRILKKGNWRERERERRLSLDKEEKREKKRSENIGFSGPIKT